MKLKGLKECGKCRFIAECWIGDMMFADPSPRSKSIEVDDSNCSSHFQLSTRGKTNDLHSGCDLLFKCNRNFTGWNSFMLKQIETRQNAADGKELNNDINKIDCNERILQLLIEISIYTLTWKLTFSFPNQVINFTE